MKKKLAAACLLAGGIALTGLSGSAFAQGGSATTTAKPGVPKGKGVSGVICAGKAGHIKGRPEKGTVTSKEPGRLPGLPKPVKGGSLKVIKDGGGKAVKGEGGKTLPAPPPGGVKITARTGPDGTVKIGKLPKGVHCSVVKPGADGTLPTPPAG
ncbi:hypothetical protein [Actinomadura sp. DC4]|uniref:hypothetical protein n=1 Tax=Actinomadura sp. DC4 TaxID=3055069 RepID=UPI0025B267FA|nr:hypothetical protein [Actinomadura sp. DC4]MDN3354748.1 hypothetical protein [Actinomadura sp. DC4]